MSPGVPTTCGPYLVQGEVGRGSSGVVLRALAPDGTAVALKLLWKLHPDALGRFERERRLLVRLGEVQGFVRILDAGRSEFGPWFAMPFLGGGSLRDRLAEGSFSVAEAVALVARLARAAGLAHERGLVHRDLKPANVLFTSGGDPLIADLGLGKDRSSSVPGDALTRTGTFHGTFGYMALEQVHDAREAGPPADVFALGSILYECLHGAPPFAGENALDVVARMERGELGPLRPDVPRGLAAVLRAALDPDPARRPPDGAALARALESGRLPRRGRALVGLMLLLVVVGSGWRAVAQATSRVPSAGPLPTEAREALAGSLIERARELRRRGTLPVAHALLLEALALTPRRAEAHREVGLVALARGDLSDARRSLDRALELDPVDSETWLARAVTRARGSDRSGALEDVEKALGLAPRLARGLRFRGLLRFGGGDVPGARADLDRAVELAPGDAEGWVERSTLRRSVLDIAGALADLDRALELEPGHTTALARRGELRLRTRDHAGALADLDRALALEPDHATSWLRRGDAQISLGNRAAAQTDFTRAIELDPTVFAAWFGRATARLGAHDHPGALADLDRALALDPRSAEALYLRALLRKEASDLTGALGDLDVAVEASPRFSRALILRAQTRAQIGESAGAAADLDRAVEASPDDPEPWLARGGFRRALGNADGARADLERCLALDADGPSGAAARAALAGLGSR